MKRLTAFIFVLVTFFCIADLVEAEEIDSFSSDITINQDGTINVEETIVYEFGLEERHGIFRDIPFVKTNAEGKKFVLTFDQINVANEESTQTKEGDNIQLKIGDPGRLTTGLHTYIISYGVSGALSYFSDHDELYWNVTGNDWDVSIENVETSIRLPEDFDTSLVQLACYTGTTGSRRSDCQTSYKDGTIVINSNSLLPEEGLTVVVGFPKGAVSVLEPKAYVTFFETVWGKIVLAAVILVAFVWYVITPGIVVYRWWKYGRDPKPAMGEVTAWFDSPKTKGQRRLRPAEAGTLLDETVHKRDITSSIIDLARRGYVKIRETKRDQFELEKRDTANDDEKILPFEQILLAKIFTSSNTVKLKDTKLSPVILQIQKAIYDQVVSDGFFHKSPQRIRTIYSVLAVLALVTGNLLLALVAFTFGMGMPRKTLFGAEQAAVAKSLKNFLSSQREKLEFQAKNQMFFEKFLSYAVAFGVENIWAERFREIHLTKPDWYEGSFTNSIVFSRTLGIGLGRSFSFASASRSTSGFSSGFSGGSSGGGGGGGGGGSW